jgi:3-oxoacyl-[acyl-carrier-protein] synthase II
MPFRRVVVTGVGQVSSLGVSLGDFRTALWRGSPGVRRLSKLDVPGVPEPIGADVPDFNPSEMLPGKNLATVSRGGQFGYAAAAQAFRMSGLGTLDNRAGIYVGTGFGGIFETEETYRACFSREGSRPRPTTIPTAMANAPAGFLASEFRLRGPNLTFTVACASSSHAIGEAFRVVRQGETDLMFAGGVEAPLTPIVLSAWAAMRVLAPAGTDPAASCRPFSADRKGIVVGEGSGFLILEELRSAERRGASVLAEIVGYGRNADAGHPTHPDPDGVRTCLRLALEDAGIPPSSVGYVNAHGTGTPVNDLVEAEALADVLGERPTLLVSSTKAAHGHAMGASGALEAIATVLALREGTAPPTANLAEPDPALPHLGYVRGEPAAMRTTCALSNSFAFGGNNAVLVFRAMDPLGR